MHLEVQPLKKEEADLFNKADEAAFNVHARYFPDGIVPGAAEDDRGEYDLKKVMDDPKYTVLSIKDDGRFVGGAIVEETGKNSREIEIFFLIVEYQSKGIGKEALALVEGYFPDTKVFRLITPSNVVRNTVFYVNKCGYRIVKVVGFDRDLILQVLYNLVINANRHTENSVIQLTGGTDDRQTVITVTDHGDGISPELLDKVFERGFSGDGSTGYGLSICRTIMDMHHGDISIRAGVDGGTVVEIVIYRKDNEDAENPAD